MLEVRGLNVDIGSISILRTVAGSGPIADGTGTDDRVIADLAGRALVVPRDDDHLISTLDVHHTTSWASEMIFM